MSPLRPIPLFSFLLRDPELSRYPFFFPPLSRHVYSTLFLTSVGWHPTASRPRHLLIGWPRFGPFGCIIQAAVTGRGRWAWWYLVFSGGQLLQCAITAAWRLRSYLRCDVGIGFGMSLRYSRFTGFWAPAGSVGWRGLRFLSVCCLPLRLVSQGIRLGR